MESLLSAGGTKQHIEYEIRMSGRIDDDDGEKTPLHPDISIYFLKKTKNVS